MAQRHMHGRGEGLHGGGMHGRGACVAGETATTADGMYPIGMHSCFDLFIDNLLKFKTNTSFSGTVPFRFISISASIVIIKVIIHQSTNKVLSVTSQRFMIYTYENIFLISFY